MTSILRTFSQIPVREKYLLVTAAPAVISGDPSQVSAFTLTPGAFISVTSVATDADIDVPATGYDSTIADNLTNGALYKDLGRQITIYDPADHKHLAVFRQVQTVDGIGSEGVDVEPCVS